MSDVQSYPAQVRWTRDLPRALLARCHSLDAAGAAGEEALHILRREGHLQAPPREAFAPQAREGVWIPMAAAVWSHHLDREKSIASLVRLIRRIETGVRFGGPQRRDDLSGYYDEIERLKTRDEVEIAPETEASSVVA